MNFPKWAPAEAVEIYRWMIENERSAGGDLSIDELNDHAVRSDFPNWAKMNRFLQARKLCLERLITNDSVRPFWDWLESSPNRENIHVGYIWRRVESALKDWYVFPHMTANERKKDLADIAAIAKKLAREIAKYEGSFALPTAHTELIPVRYHPKIKKVLHPDLISRFEARGHNPVKVLDQVLPSFVEYLTVFSKKVEQDDTPPRTARKARSRSALRKKMIDALFDTIGSSGHYSSTHWANFMSVALDDDTITDATVRMAIKDSEWYEFAKDNGII